MFIPHEGPGNWQSFLKRKDNVGLTIMEARQKYLKEQLLFESYFQTLNTTSTVSTAAAGAAGGRAPSTGGGGGGGGGAADPLGVNPASLSYSTIELSSISGDLSSTSRTYDSANDGSGNIIVSGNGFVLISSDYGDTWTKVGIEASTQFYKVATDGNGTWVVGGFKSSGTIERAYYSTDNGATWTGIGRTDAFIYFDILWDDASGKFILGGYLAGPPFDPNGGAVYYVDPSDMTTFVQAGNYNTENASFRAYNYCLDIVNLGTKYIFGSWNNGAAPSEFNIWESTVSNITSHTSWDPVGNLPADFTSEINYSNFFDFYRRIDYNSTSNVLIAIVGDGSTLAVKSTDKGENWTTFNLAVPHAKDILYANGYWIAPTQGDTAPDSTSPRYPSTTYNLSSDNGETWTSETIPSAIYNGVEYIGNDRYLFTADGALVLGS
jgi:hypothetical protein